MLSFKVISMSLQMIASLKCQYAELLSDIGFIKADLTARKIGRLAPRTGDGVLAATGEEVLYLGGFGSFCEGQFQVFSFVCFKASPRAYAVRKWVLLARSSANKCANIQNQETFDISRH